MSERDKDRGKNRGRNTEGKDSRGSQKGSGRDFRTKNSTGEGKYSRKKPGSDTGRKFEKDSDEKYDKPAGRKSYKDSGRKYSKDSDRKNEKGPDKRFDKSAGKRYEKDPDRRYDKASSGKPYRDRKVEKDSSRKYGKDPRKEKEKSKFKDRLHVEDVRLNRFIANAGVCSRRDADELIKQGKIKVNGQVVTEMGLRVKHTDRIEYKGENLKPETFQYVLLNKPKDFITTMDDPNNRKTVMKLVQKACPERIYPVGRLDRHTTGLLLFTNDGELAKKLTHPSFKIKKIYQVEIDRPIAKADFDAIVDGVELEDGKAVVDELAQVGPGGQVLGIEIHIGKNRIVRRIFEHFGYKVVKLDRVMFGPLTKKDLSRGKYRLLSPKEIQHLKNSVKKS